MRKYVVDELEVAAPADTLWAIYSTLQFPKLIVELVPNVIENIEFYGDGSLGTILKVIFVQGTVPSSYKEKFVTIDHEKRLKEVVHIEGGYLDMGCSFYMSSFQILEKGSDSCIIKSMVTYELAKDTDPSVDDMVNNVTVLAAVAQAMSKYVLDKQGEAAAAAEAEAEAPHNLISTH